MKKRLILSAFATLLAYTASAQTTVAAKNAAKHIGETVTICDKVFSGKLVTPSNTTLMNIGSYDPDLTLTVVIPATARDKFKGTPEADYTGKDVTVTGKLISYKGKPGIIIIDPKQLKIVLVDNARTPFIPIK